MLLIFDCDGVLVDSEVISNRVLAAHLSRHGYPVTSIECRDQFLGRTIPGVIDLVKAEGIDLPDNFEATLRDKDIKAFAEELKPVMGMQATLERLQHIPKCVASSGSPEKIRTNLQTTGLLGYFDSNLSALAFTFPFPFGNAIINHLLVIKYCYFSIKRITTLLNLYINTFIHKYSS